MTVCRRTALIALVFAAPGASQPPATRPADRSLPEAPGQAESLLEAAGPGYTLRRTPHFLVAYNSPRSTLESLVTRLESTYAAVLWLCSSVGIEPRPLPTRLEVVFHDRPADYLAWAARAGFSGAGTYGFYSESSNRSAFYNVANDPELLALEGTIADLRANLDGIMGFVRQSRGSGEYELRYADGRRVRLDRPAAERELKRMDRELKSLDRRRDAYGDRVNRTVVQHETAHQVLFNVGLHVRGTAQPRWLVEGLACLFETPPGPLGTGLGVVNEYRLRDLREAVGARADGARLSGADLAEAVAGGRLPGPRELILDPARLAASGDRATAAYAVAWGLTHYLHRVRRDDLAACLRVLSARRAGQRVTPREELELFERHFGPADDAFVARMGDYLFRLRLRPSGDLR